MMFRCAVQPRRGITWCAPDPGARAEVLEASIDGARRRPTPTCWWSQDTFDEIRANFFGADDRAMAWMLVVVIAALLLVTALGIVGLASFWVQAHQADRRAPRALGADPRQILRYFQLENFLLATVGIVLGMLMAYSINQLLMAKYELPRCRCITCRSAPSRCGCWGNWRCSGRHGVPRRCRRRWRRVGA